MANFEEAIRTDKGLQKQLVDAIKKVADDNGLSLDVKSYLNKSNVTPMCADSCGTLCVCSV